MNTELLIQVNTVYCFKNARTSQLQIRSLKTIVVNMFGNNSSLSVGLLIEEEKFGQLRRIPPEFPS